MRFEGIIVPMITPFRKDHSLDEDRLREFVDYLIDGGVHGLFPSSSIGEFTSMTPQERKKVIEIVIEHANERVPVIPGTGSSDLGGVREMLRFIEDLGGSGAVVVTPYYLRPDQEGLIDYFNRVASSCQMPILMYQIPMMTGVSMTGSTIARIAEENSNIVGMKDSSGDMAGVLEIKRKAPRDFLIFQGFDVLLVPSLEYGCAGGMVGTPNILPEIAVDAFAKIKEGDPKSARSIQTTKLSPLFEACMSQGVFPAGFKHACSILGLDLGPTRPPIRSMTIEEKGRLEDELRNLGLM